MVSGADRPLGILDDLPECFEAYRPPRVVTQRVHDSSDMPRPGRFLVRAPDTPPHDATSREATREVIGFPIGIDTLFVQRLDVTEHRIPERFQTVGHFRGQSS